MKKARKTLSFLLCLVLIVGILPVSVMADGENVAKIGNTEYTTLDGAISEAKDGDTVVLVQDTKEDITVSGDKTITIDLNGKKLTNCSGDTIVVEIGATLTVTGSGTVDNVTNGKAAIYNNGTVILNGGSYTRSQETGVDKDNSGGNSYYNILNHGTMTIGENVSVTSRGHFSSLIANGYYNFSNTNPRSGYVSGTNQESPQLTINGGTFSGGINTIKNDDNATLVINDGSFSNVTQAVVQNNHVAEIHGGSFDANNYHAIENRHFDGGHNTGSIIVTNGIFTGELVTTEGATWSITGGTFSTNPSEYVVENGVKYIVKRDGDADANYVYTVLLKSNLTSGVYLTDPTDALASGYYVSSKANGVWTVSSFGGDDSDPTYAIGGTVGGVLLAAGSTNAPAPTLDADTHTAYVEGYPDGTVKPNGKITRAETAAILYRLMTPQSRKAYLTNDSNFHDVDFAAWYNTYVATLNAAGVITDSENGYFRPNDAITRAELAAMLAQFAKTRGGAYTFTDVTVEHWAANAIRICANLGWINGYPDGTFRPDATITRAELMAMLNRATGRTPREGTRTWRDNADKSAWYYLDVQTATND